MTPSRPISARQWLFLFGAGALLFVCGAKHVLAATAELTLVVGEPFILGAETTLRDPLYTWVLSKDNHILETQAEKFFRMNPMQEGMMELALTIRTADGTSEEQHSFPMRIVPKAEIDPAGSPFVRAVIRSEPPSVGPEKTVTLPLEGGIITLFLDESTGSIREYRIDANIAFDSDSDSIPDNDADNIVHPSFTAGGSFPMSIVPAPGERERVVQLRVFGVNGEVSEARFRILFDPNAALSPVLRTLPPMEQSGVLRIPPEGGVVRFDATGTTGGAARFALDLNLSGDTDYDLDPTNDNDLRGTSFELSGAEVAMLLLPKGGVMERRIGLTVTNASGEASTRTFTILFGEGGGIAMPEPLQPQVPLKLTADRDRLSVGTSFRLKVENAPPGTAAYAWDLQSDGAIDTETSEPSLLLEPDAPGVLPVRVLLKESNGDPLAVVNGEFTVLPAADQGNPMETIPPPNAQAARIDIVTEALTVSFQPVLTDGGNIVELYPTWDFGDGSKSYLLAPVHLYEATGTYEVKLTLTDPASGREAASATSTISVEGATPSEPAPRSGFFAGIFRTIAFIFKVIFFVLLLLLLLTGGVLVYAFMQAQAERATLKDVLLSYKRKITGEAEPEVVGKSVPEIIEAASAKKKESDEPAPMKLVAEEVVKKEAPPSSPQPKPATPPPPQAQLKPAAAPQGEKGQLPPWLQAQERPSLPRKPLPPLTAPPPAQAAPASPQPPPPAPPKMPAPPTPPVPASAPQPPTKDPSLQKSAVSVSTPTPITATQKSVPPPAMVGAATSQAPTPPATKIPPTPPPAAPISSIPASTDHEVPTWLKAGMGKIPEEKNVPRIPDDETIAMVKAELPEEDDEEKPLST